jgi:hypothetical protein
LPTRSALRCSKGTILHIIDYFDNAPGNRNVPDRGNWSGSANRSITNMFIDLDRRRRRDGDGHEVEGKKARFLGLSLLASHSRISVFLLFPPRRSR